MAPSFDGLITAGLYVSPLRDAIQALKYGGVRPLAPTLARLAAPGLAAIAPAVVAPVPSHPRRVAARGLDHTRLLAREVAQATDLPWLPDLLVRTRATLPQVGLERAARRANVAGAFRVQARVPTPVVVLVDDVLTTGATASACAEALRAAGAARVVACTVARAVTVPARGLGRLGARHV